jgi:ribosomal protein S18 acetylase RimI-like enzyme
MTHRPATAADLPLILRAERAYMEDVEPASLDSWTLAIDRNLELWVANLDRTTVLLVGDEPAGYVMWTASGSEATLISVQVLPAFRRRGLGRELLELFATQAAEHSTLLLGVHRDNPARSIYPAAGYEHTGDDGAYLLFSRAN